MSIDPGNLEHWHRYPEEVLNGIKFDCSLEGEECLQERSVVLKHYDEFLDDYFGKALANQAEKLEREGAFAHTSCKFDFITEAELQDLLTSTAQELLLR